MAVKVQFKTTKTGRMRGPNLSDPSLKIIGDAMVAEQKARWARAYDAGGNPAKKLSVKYSMIKQAYQHQQAWAANPGQLSGLGVPVRDMNMTGATIKNFTLRKAAEGRIRAENTTRLERSKAQKSNSYDQMIGFALTDSKVIFDESQKQYGQYVKTAWIPLDTGGRARRPSTF